MGWLTGRYRQYRMIPRERFNVFLVSNTEPRQSEEVRGGEQDTKHFPFLPPVQTVTWLNQSYLTQEVKSRHLGSLSSYPISTFFLSPLPLTLSNCLFYPLACPSPAEDWKQQLSEGCWESTWTRIRKLILWLPRFPHVLKPVCHSSCMTEPPWDVRHFLMDGNEQLFLEELRSSKESFSQTRNGSFQSLDAAYFYLKFAH